jgi:hypothetical protein
MLKIGSLSFPIERAENVAECFLKLPPAPEYINISGPYVRGEVEKNMVQTLTVFEFEESKLLEVSEYLNKRYEQFKTIEGLTSEVEEWVDVQTALSLLENVSSPLDALQSFALGM